MGLTSKSPPPPPPPPPMYGGGDDGGMTGPCRGIGGRGSASLARLDWGLACETRAQLHATVNHACMRCSTACQTKKQQQQVTQLKLEPYNTHQYGEITAMWKSIPSKWHTSHQRVWLPGKFTITAQTVRPQSQYGTSFKFMPYQIQLLMVNVASLDIRALCPNVFPGPNFQIQNNAHACQFACLSKNKLLLVHPRARNRKSCYVLNTGSMVLYIWWIVRFCHLQ